MDRCIVSIFCRAASLKVELKGDIAGLRKEMMQGDNSLLAEFQKSKTDTIRWMFIFWIGQLGALLGILFAVFK